MGKIRSLLSSALGICVFLVVAGLAIYLSIALVRGGVGVAAQLFPYITDIASLTFAVLILVLVPLSFIPMTYRFAYIGISIVVVIFSFTTWVWCALLTYSLWGIVALVVGFFFVGVGVIPLALLATLFNGMWAQFGQVLVMISLVFGLGVFASYVSNKADRRQRRRGVLRAE